MGNKIKELREKAHLTQQELADLSGLSRATIVTLENSNGCNTTTNTLAKVARALGTTFDALFFGNSG